MFLVNSPGPTALQLMPQRLRLAYAFERVSLNVADEPNDPQGLPSVLLYPPSEVLEGGGSNSKLFNDGLDRYPVLPVLGLQQTASHGIRFE